MTFHCLHLHRFPTTTARPARRASSTTNSGMPSTMVPATKSFLITLKRVVFLEGERTAPKIQANDRTMSMDTDEPCLQYDTPCSPVGAPKSVVCLQCINNPTLCTFVQREQTRISTIMDLVRSTLHLCLWGISGITCSRTFVDTEPLRNWGLYETRLSFPREISGELLTARHTNLDTKTAS